MMGARTVTVWQVYDSTTGNEEYMPKKNEAEDLKKAWGNGNEITVEPVVVIMNKRGICATLTWVPNR